jgi:beta-phosphoglucomutase family hydrolase
MLGLPDAVRACLFDMDGVITKTAVLHAAAWKEMFDEYLRKRADQEHVAFVPFTTDDYDRYVDGKPRLDGTAGFLKSRGIDLPQGSPDDAPGTPTIWGLSNRKNDLVLAKIAAGAVETYPGSVSYVSSVKKNGLKTAIVSSSANTKQVLEVAGLSDLFDVRVDAQFLDAHSLRGKPAPDSYLAAAKELGVTAAEAAVYEDALAGVESGRAGNFALVVGVDRVGQADELRAHGADIVVKDLSELLDEK